MKKIFYLSIVSFIVFTSCNFAPGSYPYAEVYEFDVSEKVLIESVEKFKKFNTEYTLSNQKRFIDGKKNEKDYWYHIWFYYPDRNKVVKSWIRANKIAFIGIGDGMNLANYKEINKDFNYLENEKEKKKFEEKILKKIKENLR